MFFSDSLVTNIEDYLKTFLDHFHDIFIMKHTVFAKQ